MATGRPLLLVADDDLAVLDIVTRVALHAGFDVVQCAHGADVRELLQGRPPDLALVDLRMPDVDGLDLLREIKAAAPRCEMVLMTGHASVETAVDAIRLGARDYISKPFDLESLSRTLIELREGLPCGPKADGRAAGGPGFFGMIGESPVMRDLFTLIERMAPHARVVLITGETGTGKELAARALHQAGPRASKPFITINCSAVVGSLFESELFGHVRGAFTGAVENKPGLFEAADGGTLFLDEVGELPPAVQAKLLRVLENGEVQRVGSLEPRTVDVTIVAATNRDLRLQAAAGRFRADLYYRLNVAGLGLPALRDRREDIPRLAAAFLRECSLRFHKTLTGLTVPAEFMLLQPKWEGNVRELRNCIERAALLTSGATVSERDMARAMGVALPRPITPMPRVRAVSGTEMASPTALGDLERGHIVDILTQLRGNRMAAARVLGISRRALYRRLERYHIGDEVPRYAGPRG